MEDAKYPASYGNVTHLNQNGVDLVEMSVDFYHNKYWIGYKDDRNIHNPARGWTYRDMDCSTYKSLWSGSVSTPFAGHWLDVDDHGCLVDDASDCGIPRVLKSMDSAFLGRPLPPGADVADDTDVDGIQSLFEDSEVFDVAIIMLAALLFISASTRIAFAKESDTKCSSNGMDKSAKTTRSRRFHSIDVLRELCVFKMISIHFGEYLSAQWFRNCSLFGTPAFLLVAGLSKISVHFGELNGFGIALFSVHQHFWFWAPYSFCGRTACACGWKESRFLRWSICRDFFAGFALRAPALLLLRNPKVTR